MNVSKLFSLYIFHYLLQIWRNFVNSNVMLVLNLLVDGLMALEALGFDYWVYLNTWFSFL